MITGKAGGVPSPKRKATRAEITAMLMRLLEKYEPQQKANPNTGAGWFLAALTASAAGMALCARALRRRKKEEEPAPA